MSSHTTTYKFHILCDLHKFCEVMVRQHDTHHTLTAKGTCASACKSVAQREQRIAGAILAGAPCCLETLSIIRTILRYWHGPFDVLRFVRRCSVNDPEIVIALAP